MIYVQHVCSLKKIINCNPSLSVTQPILLIIICPYPTHARYCFCNTLTSFFFCKNCFSIYTHWSISFTKKVPTYLPIGKVIQEFSTVTLAQNWFDSQSSVHMHIPRLPSLCNNKNRNICAQPFITKKNIIYFLFSVKYLVDLRYTIIHDE